jgi:quinol monooxygenase YgiN
MIAHVVTYQATPEQVDHAQAVLRDEIWPTLRDRVGFIEAQFLRQPKSALIITLWTDKGAIEASEEQWRREAATQGALEQIGGTRTLLGLYEVSMATR